MLLYYIGITEQEELSHSYTVKFKEWNKNKTYHHQHPPPPSSTTQHRRQQQVSSTPFPVQTTSTTSSSERPLRIRSTCCCSASCKMAKLTACTIFLAFFLILTIMAIYGEPQSPEVSRGSKVRSKLASAIRRKKTGTGTKAKVELGTTTPTTTTTITASTLEGSGGGGGSTGGGDDADEGTTQDIVIAEATSEVNNLNVEEVVTTEESTTSTSTRAPKSNKKLRANNFAGTGAPSTVAGCDECDQEECNVVKDSSCQNGLVLDRCSCCYVCGALEGNRCFNASLNLPYNPDVGICGPHLDCLLRNDLDPTEPREALCECRDKRIVCGNDHQTYMSECKLREAAHSKIGLMVTSWSPCVSAPVMTTPVENATVAVGEDVSLSCEVRAYPAPILHWEFLAEGAASTSLPLILPGDDSGIVVVVRGGPEQIMTTSWIQIIAVNPKRQGTYYCVAKNAEGTAQALAQVQVYKGFEDDDDD